MAFLVRTIKVMVNKALDLIDQVTTNPNHRPSKESVDNVNTFDRPDGNSNAYALRKLRKDRLSI